MEICKLTALDLMQSELVTVNASQTLLDVKHIYEKKKFHHHIPVLDGNKPVGMISLSDFLFAIRTDSLDDNERVYHEKNVKDIMSHNPVCLATGSTIGEILAVLATGEIHAVLITEGSDLKGIVTSTDILRFLKNECSRHDRSQDSR